MRFHRHQLPVGDENIPVLVSSEDGQPRAVFMSYEAFLEIAATLYTAVEALKLSGIDPAELFGDEDEEDALDLPDEATVEDFASHLHLLADVGLSPIEDEDDPLDEPPFQIT